MKLTSKKLIFSATSIIRPERKLDGSEVSYNWEDKRLKLNMIDINNGFLTINSPNTYTYCINNNNNYFLYLDKLVNGKNKKRYIVIRDIWSENVGEIPPLKDIYITGTSKKDVVWKHKASFQRIVEPQNTTGIRSFDNNLLKPEDRKLGDRAYINAGPKFWYHSNSYQDENNLRFYEGKYVGPEKRKWDITKEASSSFNFNDMYSMYNIFNNWKGATIDRNQLSTYKNNIDKFKNLINKFRNGYNVFKLNDSNLFKVGITDNYYIMTDKDTNTEFSEYSNQGSPSSSVNINCDFGNIEFSHFTNDNLDVKTGMVNKKINITYNRNDYAETNIFTEPTFQNWGDDTSDKKYITNTNKVYTTIRTYPSYNNPKPIDTNFLPVKDEVGRNKFLGDYYLPDKFNILDFPNFNSSDNQLTFMVFIDNDNKKEIYFDINGRYIIAENKIRSIRPHYGSYQEQINMNSLTFVLYTNNNFHLNNNIEKFPNFITSYFLQLYNSEGLRKTDGNTAIEKLLKIHYEVNNRPYVRTMISSENKHIVDTNTATSSELFFSKKANSVEMDQLEVQKQQAKVANIGNITRNLIASASRTSFLGEWGNIVNQSRNIKHNQSSADYLRQPGFNWNAPRTKNLINDIARARQERFTNILNFGGGIIGGIGNLSATVASFLTSNKQIETMEDIQNLKRMNFQRQIALQSSPIINNYQVSNTAFMKEVYNSKYGVYMSFDTFDSITIDKLELYHKENGYDITGREKLVNLRDYTNEFLKIEDNDMYQQLPSKLANDNEYIEGVLAAGIILKDVR